jgi:hypothetical protein
MTRVLSILWNIGLWWILEKRSITRELKRLEKRSRTMECAMAWMIARRLAPELFEDVVQSRTYSVYGRDL